MADDDDIVLVNYNRLLKSELLNAVCNKGYLLVRVLLRVLLIGINVLNANRFYLHLVSPSAASRPRESTGVCTL